MPRRIPNADSLIRNYPHGDADTVKREIGGRVDAGWIQNTCAIRLSRSFNKAGEHIPKGVSYLNTVSGGDRLQYAYRVREFEKWLRRKYGAPTLEAQGTGSSSPPESFKGKKGIICFVDCGWSDATGHLDLWDGNKCVNKGYFNVCKKVLLWESNPAPIQPPSRVPGRPRTGTVTATRLNVRRGPGRNNAIVGKVERGQIVTVLGEEGDYFLLANGGWVAKRYIRIGTPRPATSGSGTSSSSRTGTVTASRLNIRERPTAGARVVGTVLRGEQVAILATRSGFYQIGPNAWASSRYIRT